MSNPITAVFPLTTDLSGSGQSGPLALTGSGAPRIRTVGGTTGALLEAAATNWCTRPLSPNAFAYAHLSLSELTGQVVTHPVWGGNSDRFRRLTVASPSGTLNCFGVQISISGVAAGANVPIQLLLRSSAGMAGKTMHLVVSLDGGVNPAAWSPPGSRSLTTDWAVLSGTITMDYGDRTAIYVYGQVAIADQIVGEHVDVTFVDVREWPGIGSPVPEVDSSGVVTTGHSWSGTAHASTSTRAASSAAISPSGIFDTYLGAIVFRATPTVETGAEEIWGELGEKGAGTDHIRWGRDATKHPYVEWSGNDSAYTRITLTPTVDAGDEHFYSIEWHVGDADFRLYLDDNPSDNDTIPSPQEDYGAGTLKLEATAGGVIYNGLMICNERLTNAQRARLQDVDHWSVRTLERLRVEVARPQFELRPY